MDTERRRLGRALGASAAVHAGLAVLLLLVIGVSSTPSAVQAPPDVFKSIYIASAGPAGGGGGHAGPASNADRAVTRRPDPVPVTATPVVADPPRTPVLDAPIAADPSKLLAVGTGVSPYAQPGGGGRGDGAGPGRGPGEGPGEGGNRGGGPRQVGNGVSSPVPLVQVRPAYTNDAMRSKIQGSVTLEVVVKADGTAGDVRIVKSLDRIFGLDEAAIAAVRQWRFKPGTFEGKPVDVIVHIVLDFRIH